MNEYKFLEELFIIFIMLEHLKKRCDNRYLFLIADIEAAVLASFEFAFENYNRKEGI